MRRKKRTARPKRIDKPTPPPGRVALWKRLLRAAPVVVFLVLLTFIFNRLGVMHRLEMVVLDAQMLLNQPSASEVTVVEITNDDYHDPELFRGESPLHANTLKHLIWAISQGEPAVIGVDIDTSSQKFSELAVKELCPENIRCPEIVWQRELFFPPQESELPEPLDVLGRYDAKLIDFSGVAILIDDSEDKVTRRYTRRIQTKAGAVPTFAFAVAQRYLFFKGAKRLPEHSEPMFIEFRGDRRGSHRDKSSATLVLSNYQSQEWKDRVRDKIVLVGGSYLDQDRHYTPLGTMVGVDILANVIETELGGGGPQPLPKFAIYLLEFFDSFLIILLFQLFSFRRALLWSLGLLIPIAVICSAISLGSPWRFSYFAVLMIGVLVYESQQHYREHAVLRVYRDLKGEQQESATDKPV
jgi:CHASE2 domain-containing sensor protein